MQRVTTGRTGRRAITRALVVLAALVVSLVHTRAARASDDVRLTVDWSKFLDQSYSFLKHEVENPAGSRTVASSQPSTASSWLGSFMGAPEDADAPWVVFAPHVSLVARDWRNARILRGDVLALTDQMRVTGSSRMVLARVHLGGGRLAPFAQLGAGEWRVDRDMVANYAGDQERAVQAGVGVESKVSRVAAIALETDYTVLMRESAPIAVAENRPSARFLGVTAAARFSF